MFLLTCCFNTVVFKTRSTCDTSYIIQTIIAYQHSATAKSLLRYANLYNYYNDQTIPLNMGKKAQKFKILLFFITSARMFFFVISLVWLKINLVPPNTESNKSTNNSWEFEKSGNLPYKS